MPRIVRSQAARSLLVGLTAGLLLLALGLLRYELAPVWYAGAGVVVVLLTALTWLALEPNAPHHPQAGREDRGFNYVRGEGGGGGGA